VFDAYASRIYDFMKSNRRPALFILLFLIIVSLAGLFFVNYDNSMDTILPRDEVVTRSMDFFRTSDMAGKVVLAFSLNSPDRDIRELLREIDRVASSLDPELFPEVISGISEAQLSSDMDSMFQNLPGMVTESDLTWIAGRLDRESVSRQLRAAYVQLLKPEGIFMNSMLRADPLGIRSLVLKKLNAVSASMGYSVDIKDGHFVSKAGRHGMIIAKSSVPVMDSAGAKRLMASLNESLKTLPAYITVDVISGHIHTLSNEKLIKRDINVVSIIAATAFLVLFGYIIRDINALFIFAVPLIAILFAINLSFLMLGSLSYWVIGLGATVAGITIDYGTHVYFAASGRSEPDLSVKNLIKPIIYGSLTTIAVFIALFFSDIKGYNQMALFSIICVILSTALSVFVLPHILSNGGADQGFARRLSARVEKWNFSSKSAVLVWLVLTIVFAVFALNVQFENDIKQMDGTEESFLQAEERFHAIWGGKKTPAVFVAQAGDYEQALALNERVYTEAVQAIGQKDFVSLASLWPSDRTRKENAERWQRFWNADRKQKLSRLLAEEGSRYGFSKAAFEPFFDGLEKGVADGKGPGFGLSDRFIQKTKDGWQVLSFFPDTMEFVDALSDVSMRHPGTYIVSGTVLSKTMARVVAADLKLMSLVAAGGVALLLYFCFFNIRETLIALVPPLTGIVWLLGLMAIFGLTINLANMMAGVLAIGLTSDYGIFMTFQGREGKRKAGTVMAIALCTATTMIGAGVLIFAKHPALSSVGTTMLIGVGSGFLSALSVVPKLCELAAGAGKKAAA